MCVCVCGGVCVLGGCNVKKRKAAAEKKGDEKREKREKTSTC